MLTGKMTATWLITLVMVGCLGVPLLIIYLHSIHPYYISHPNVPHLILGLTATFLPNVSLINFISGTLI
ncbi:MAG: hypothetical protein M3Z01_01780 [Thermoproteota archaeon]|nr:hypothetical protein [Thermoproteota archaeon]